MAKSAKQDIFSRIALAVILAGVGVTLVVLAQGVLEVTGTELEHPAVAQTAVLEALPDAEQPLVVPPEPANTPLPVPTIELDKNFGADG
ncbi:MAG: hypothetical protein EPO32_11100 [Anaerolineae bacterium]|nr:MAG: hypothetical protein EPO32_11100 [Anaerolineae bacterium]